MTLVFEEMTKEHATAVMEIFNYYIDHSFAAYPELRLPTEFFQRFLDMTNGYPAFVLKNDESDKILGFCFLRAYHPFSVFKHTAEITYFFKKEETGKGYGTEALHKLEEEAKRIGITRLLADISSENAQSIAFHQKNGFSECGRFHGIGSKKGTCFDVVWMEKALQ